MNETASGHMGWRSSQKWIGVVYGLAIAAGLMGALLLYYSTHYTDLHRYLYGADGLYIPALFADVTSGGDFRRWVLPPIPSLFPEMALYFTIGSLTPTLHVAVVVQGMVQFLLFALGLMLVARYSLPASLGFARYGLVALMGMAFVWSVDRLEFLSQLMLTTAYHFGVLLSLPFALVLTWKLIATPRPRAVVWGMLCSLSFLVAASDGLYLIQVAGPLVGAAGALFLFKRVDFRRAMAVSAAILASSLAGLSTVFLRALVNPEIAAYVFRSSGGRASAQLLVDAFVTSGSWWPVHRALVVGFCLLCGVILVRAVVDARRGSARMVTSSEILLASFSLLVFAANVVGILAAGIFLNRSGFRYFLPMLILTGFWGFPFVVPFSRKIKTAALEWTVLGLLVVATFFVWTAVDYAEVADVFTEPVYPEWVACLDEKVADLGVSHGVANFLQASPLSMLSQRGLDAAQVDRSLAPHVWITSQATFDPTPEFALIDTSLPPGDGYLLDEQRLLTDFGPPDATVWCGENKVLVYQHGQLKDLFGQ